MCFGCSKEPSHRAGSFEHPEHMFSLRNKKNNFQLRSLLSGGHLYQYLWSVCACNKIAFVLGSWCFTSTCLLPEWVAQIDKWHVVHFLTILCERIQLWCRSMIWYGPPCEKTCLWGLRPTKVQTSLCILADWSAPLLLSFWKVSYLCLLTRNFNFLASLCSWGDWFESHFVGNIEDRFSLLRPIWYSSVQVLYMNRVVVACFFRYGCHGIG